MNPMGKDAFSVLEELRKTVTDKDPAFVSMQLRQIGLTEDFLNVLKLSNEEFTELFDRAPKRNNAYIRAMQQIGRLSKEFRINMSLFFERIVVQGTPALKSFYGFVERGLQSLQGIVMLLFDVGYKLQSVWSSIPQGLKAVMLLVTMLRIPLLALMLILDDFATW